MRELHLFEGEFDRVGLTARARWRRADSAPNGWLQRSCWLPGAACCRGHIEHAGVGQAGRADRRGRGAPACPPRRPSPTAPARRSDLRLSANQCQYCSGLELLLRPRHPVPPTAPSSSTSLGTAKIFLVLINFDFALSLCGSSLHLGCACCACICVCVQLWGVLFFSYLGTERRVQWKGCKNTQYTKISPQLQKSIPYYI